MAATGRERVDRASPHELRVLRTVAEALNGTASVTQALETTLQQVASLLGLRTAWIWLVDPRSRRFYGAAARELPPFLREPLRMAGQSCWCLKAFRSGDLSAGNIDVMECSRLRAAVGERARARTRNLRFHASIPLYFGDRALGIMNVAAPAWRKLTSRELDLLSTIASQVGVAVERARLAGETVQVARMEERTRLAREIHDTVAQGLTAIGLLLDAAIEGLPPGSPARVPLARALELSRSALEGARGSIRHLRTAGAPPLTAALASLAHSFTSETGIRVHLRSGGAASLPPAQEAELLRIAAEALTNVAKHAHATDVDVTLSAGRRRLSLVVVDDGRGIAPRVRSAGFGILGMRERAAALGGRLTVGARARGRGTRVAFTMVTEGPA